MNEYLKKNYQGSTNADEIERFRKYLRKGLQLLTPRQQQIMRMYYIDNKNGTQIADELGIKKQVVSKTLNAAIKQMNRNITIALHFQKSNPL